MAKLETIKSYLVELGFAVSQGELRKFNDALKSATADAERLAGSMTKGFVAAGVAITGALAGIGVGVLDLMNHAAAADLGFQVFARRMYMNVDAAKQMKIATDALGYSMEDIIWGPKELRDRYGTLIADQRRMNQGLGPDFETQMRRVRDVRFEFTRMGVEVEYFGMQLTKSLMDKLFGGPDSLDKRLGQLNNWIQNNLPQIADKLASSLAPIMRELGSIFDKLFTKKNLDWVVNVAVKGLENLNLLLGWLQSDNKLGNLWNNSLSQTMGGLFGSGRDDNIGKIMKAARERGIDPAHALALFEQESNFNSSAVGKLTPHGQAMGLGQLMPDKIPSGANPFDPDTNIRLSLDFLQGRLKAQGGDWRKALNDYYGHGAALPGQPSFEEYWKQFQQKESVWERQNKPSSFGAYEPTGYSGKGVDIGGVTIHVANSNAHPQDIANAVIRAIEEKMDRRVQDNISQSTGVYA